MKARCLFEPWWNSTMRDSPSGEVSPVYTFYTVDNTIDSSVHVDNSEVSPEYMFYLVDCKDA